VEVKRNSIIMGMQDFKNEFVQESENISYTLENTRESLQSLCTIINEFVAESRIPKDKIVGACINLTGRINSNEGFSYSYFFFEETPLSQIIESKIGIKTFLENDTRAMAYGEYNCGVVNNEKDVIFVNMGWGIGIGIVCNGILYYGKSGYSGEFGHSPVFDNEVICQCGKKGCLETEVSGFALERKFRLALENGSNSILSGKKKPDEFVMTDILNAINQNEDSLAIEILEEIGAKMGRYLSLLINIFNPELVVLGGALSESGMYLALPVRTAIHKYSLNLVSADMKLKTSNLGNRAGIIGSCYILRDKLFDAV
jgi:predicted NBD/HSP70 family sugar kinase